MSDLVDPGLNSVFKCFCKAPALRAMALCVLLSPGAAMAQHPLSRAGAVSSGAGTGAVQGVGPGVMAGSRSADVQDRSPALTDATLRTLGTRTGNGLGDNPSFNTGVYPGATGVGPQPVGVNPLNRNPARRGNRGPELDPPEDPRNSTERPTRAAASGPDARDTVIRPDPSRDTLPGQPGRAR